MTVFDQTWFEKHQSKLIWLLNHWLTKRWFRWVLRIRKFNIGYDKPIVQLLPHCYTVFNKWSDGGTVELTTDFRTHPKFAKRLYFAFKPLWWTMHYWDLLADVYVPQLSFGFSTLTVYPDPATSVDGAAGATTGGNLTWAQIIARTGDTANDTLDRFFDGSNLGVFVIQAAGVSNTWLELSRSIALFDTSPLTSAATVTAAVLSLFGSAKNDGLVASPNINVYTSTPASNTAVANGDYSQVGSTAQCTTPLTYAGWSIVAYNDFTFNATGISNISLTGISKFGFRNVNYDVAASVPPWVAFENTNIGAFSSDKTGTANDPMLVITYTASSIKTINGLAVAGVKTVDGLPIASVKTWNGLA